MPVTINGNGTISGLVVTTAELQDASVTTAKIAADAVTTVDIANGAVTLPKMADMATASVLGRNTAGTGAPEVLDASTARSVIGANNASNLTTGTVATARLGTGTADSTTYLRGDGSWQVISTSPTTAQVLSATAGASAGAVGTYAWAVTGSATNLAFGATLAGSSFSPGSFWTDSASSGGAYNISVMTAKNNVQAGTWRIMGSTNGNQASQSFLVLRIS